MLGSNSNLPIKYKASSEWNSNYDADHAIHVGGGYWCSKKNAGAPLYWWISFVNEPVEIVSITFVERYPAAEVEFFASSTRECAETGLVLINGTRADINNKIFENGRSYYCYGLRFTKLGNSKHNGKLASLKKFDFHFKGMSCELRALILLTATTVALFCRLLCDIKCHFLVSPLIGLSQSRF